MERQYSSEFEQLEKKISYTFKDKEFLLLALTHSTYAYEHRRFGLISNQRLEFLGDAILDFIVGEEMYKRKEDWNEGKLSKTRALVICEKTLSKEAEKLGIGKLLFLGKGEETTGGREKISTLADTMEVSTVIETINNAKACRNTDLPLIIHSDRGSQYVSKAWREATDKMQRSYSHSGYPYDNACIESFHALIKREWLNRFTIINYKHAYALVFEYIEAFYNTIRIHSHCDYMSPDEFEKLYERVSTLPAA